MSTMKAAIASQFGKPDDVLKVVDDYPKPSPEKSDEMLIRVHAVSLSPSDYRALLGDKKVVANPKTWPYVPGGDVAGVVEAVPQDCQEFAVGDRVFSTWRIYGRGGMAQYSNVSPKLTVKLPPELSFQEGAALANSAPHALEVCKRASIVQGDRVLVLGGSGGVGTTLVQLLRNQGASYIAATSTDEALMTKLGVDRTINYKTENWWEIPEFQQEPFDVIIDCAVGKEAWFKCESVLKGKKDGGRFVAVVFQDWHIDGESVAHILFHLIFPPLGRQLYNIFRRSTPEYRMYMQEAQPEGMAQVAKMAAKKEFEVIIDSRGPFPFTTQGVRDAWNLHIARGGHGKVVINID